jgi:hypothetical protein
VGWGAASVKKGRLAAAVAPLLHVPHVRRSWLDADSLERPPPALLRKPLEVRPVDGLYPRRVVRQGGKRLGRLLHDVPSYRLERVPIRQRLSRKSVQHIFKIDRSLSSEQAKLLVDVREVPHFEILGTAVEANPVAPGVLLRDLVQQMPSMRNEGSITFEIRSNALRDRTFFAFTLSWSTTKIVPAITVKAPIVRRIDSISAMGDVMAAA